MTTDDQPPDSAADRLQALALAAAELLDDLDGQRAREAAEFQAGYDLGFATGRDVGYQQAENNMQRAWSALAKKIQGWASRKSFRELEQERYPDRTHKELLLLRGRDRYPLPDRQCMHCDGTGVIPGGVRDQEQGAT